MTQRDYTDFEMLVGRLDRSRMHDYTGEDVEEFQTAAKCQIE